MKLRFSGIHHQTSHPLDPLAGLYSDLLIYLNPPAPGSLLGAPAGSLLGAFRLCAASQHFPPSLPFFGFVLCFLVNKGGFFSSIRVARPASAYDFWCGVTQCDLLLNEVAFFWHSSSDFSPPRSQPDCIFSPVNLPAERHSSKIGDGDV